MMSKQERRINAKVHKYRKEIIRLEGYITKPNYSQGAIDKLANIKRKLHGHLTRNPEFFI